MTRPTDYEVANEMLDSNDTIEREIGIRFITGDKEKRQHIVTRYSFAFDDYRQLMCWQQRSA